MCAASGSTLSEDDWHNCHAAYYKCDAQALPCRHNHKGLLMESAHMMHQVMGPMRVWRNPAKEKNVGWHLGRKTMVWAWETKQTHQTILVTCRQGQGKRVRVPAMVRRGRQGKAYKKYRKHSGVGS